jgi:hypothetical protein
VVVPLGLQVLHLDFLEVRKLTVLRWVAAGLAIVALVLPPGPLVGLLAVPWLTFAAYVALRTLTSEGLTLRTIASGYLAFGAAWFVMAVGDVQPMDLAPSIVILTAVHFHYAGFGALLIAFSVGERLPQLRHVPAVGIAAAMPLVAVGFTSSRTIGFVGILLLAASLVLTALASANYAIRVENGRERTLLLVGASTILVGMALAVHYGAGLAFGFPTLTIERMAQTHGIANAVFVISGLMAWALPIRATYSYGPHASLGTPRP